MKSTMSAVAAVLLTFGAAQAAPILLIGDGTTSGTQEVIGDPGGTKFNLSNGVTAGRGLPTLDGGWANATSFAPDPSYLDGTHRGISGWHSTGANLMLRDLGGPSLANVTFTFVGKGDSVLANEFWVDTGSGFVKLFPDGGSPPYRDGTSITVQMATNGATGILLPFKFVTGSATPVTITNGSNLNHDTSPAFFLGVDPYSTSTQFDTTGTAVYVGLTDLPGTGDHDFQDLGVLITVAPVPEPAAVLGLVLAAAAGAVRLRRWCLSPATRQLHN